jgi:hypothetical protein
MPQEFRAAVGDKIAPELWVNERERDRDDNRPTAVILSGTLIRQHLQMAVSFPNSPVSVMHSEP